MSEPEHTGEPVIGGAEPPTEVDDLAELAEHDDVPVGDDQPGLDPPTGVPGIEG